MTASVRCTLNPSFTTIRWVPQTTQYPLEMDTAGGRGSGPAAAEQVHAHHVGRVKERAVGSDCDFERLDPIGKRTPRADEYLA